MFRIEDFSTKDLTPQEIALIENQIYQRKFNDVITSIENVKNEQLILRENIEDQRRLIVEVKEKQDAQEARAFLGNVEYSSYCKKFQDGCKARIYRLLGDNTSAANILFYDYFCKKIYGDIKTALEIPDWRQINMTDFENPNSEYNRAKQYRNSWKPNRRYFNRVLNDMIKKRDLGFLPAIKCRALTLFLVETNNGQNVSFVA